jgi:hypothetical protein
MSKVPGVALFINQVPGSPSKPQKSNPDKDTTRWVSFQAKAAQHKTASSAPMRWFQGHLCVACYQVLFNRVP